ncbi:hypothetical protein PV10_00358 [Exophiala mesophila]|uniref:Isochorismatase-like domain-containing protein n=1 Tax=Exophiala mesophila TaxID=212818 RepID=A0A0D1Y725_EXOME|nr:uncharacterized protein PV10_00358 [Exophiala mesophila]KIV96496.1 hypothetical protein PV10_00358 [Exophiala mesophila]
MAATPHGPKISLKTWRRASEYMLACAQNSRQNHPVKKLAIFQTMSSAKPHFPTEGALRFGKRPALIVIDVCNAYLTPESPLYAPDRFSAALNVIEQTIELFRSLNLPIVFTKISLGTAGAGGLWFTEKLPNIIPCFMEGSELGQYPSTSKVCRYRADRPRVEFELSKQFSSCFFGTALSSLLVSMGVETTVIVGFSTSGCVRATALDAIQNGFRPFVIRDACGDRDEVVHSSNLFDIQAKIAEVISSDQLADEMKHLDKFCQDTGSFRKT